MPSPATIKQLPGLPPRHPRRRRRRLPTNSGFLHELGSWWNGSIAYFSAKLKDARGTFEDLGKTSKEAAKGAATATQEAMKNAVDVGKDAAGVVVRLPNTRLIEMRERCDKAPNGAPDCAAAVANGCRAKGFTGGKLLEVSSAITCRRRRRCRGKSPSKSSVPWKRSSPAPFVSKGFPPAPREVLHRRRRGAIMSGAKAR